MSLRLEYLYWGFGGVGLVQLLGFLAAEFAPMRGGAALIILALLAFCLVAGALRGLSSGYGYGFSYIQLQAAMPWLLGALAILLVVTLGAWASLGW